MTGWVVTLENTATGTNHGNPTGEQFNHLGMPPNILSPRLAKVDEKIIFKPSSNDEFTARLYIQNIAHGCSIIFKIKTTSPDRYRVRPTIAVIEPGGIAKIPIVAQAGVPESQIEEDRFQVQVCVIPKTWVNDENESVSSADVSIQNTNFAYLSGLFKSLIGQCTTAMDAYKVEVSVESRAIQQSCPPCPAVPHCSLNEETLRKALHNSEEKIAESVYMRLQTQLNFIKTLLYILLAVLILLIIGMLAIWSKSGNEETVIIDCEESCPDYVHKSKCGGCYGTRNGGFF